MPPAAGSGCVPPDGSTPLQAVGAGANAGAAPAGGAAGEEASDGVPLLGAGNARVEALRRSLTMRTRQSSALLSTLLVHAYPAHTKETRRKNAGRPKCHSCGEPGHHLKNCPFNPNSHLEQRRHTQNILHS